MRLSRYATVLSLFLLVGCAETPRPVHTHTWKDLGTTVSQKITPPTLWSHSSATLVGTKGSVHSYKQYMNPFVLGAPFKACIYGDMAKVGDAYMRIK